MSAKPWSILCLLPDVTTGGAQRSMINYANTLHEMGISVELVVLKTRGLGASWISPDLPVTFVGASSTKTAIPALWRHLLRRRPDVLFSTMLDANIVGWVVRSFLPFKLIHLVRETNSHRARRDLSTVSRYLAGYAYRAAHHVVALSEGVGIELVCDYEIAPQKVTTLGNPVDVETFRTSMTGVDPWPRDSTVGYRLLAVGRLVEQKGFDLLLPAVAALDDPRISLVILGDGPLEEPLKALAQELDIADRVHFAGRVDHPSDWYCHADLFVLSSRWEGFGHVVVEAMAAGLPVVATDCPHGPRDIINSPDVGFLIEDVSVDGIHNALASAIQDQLRLQTWSASGKKRALVYGRESVTMRLVALVDRLVRNPAPLSALQKS